MRLSTFIAQNKEPILQEWENFARSIEPPGRTMDIAELRDHAAVMLDTIMTDLDTTQTAFEQSEKSIGQGPRGNEETNAEMHASARLQSGFTINQLVAEFRALRASVLKLWAQSTQSVQQTDLVDMTRFNEAIDQALAESVAQFSQISHRWDAILEAAPVGIIMADINGKLIQDNAENKRIWGEFPMSEDIYGYVERKGWWADGSEKQGRQLSPHEWALARALTGEEVTRDIVEIEPFGLCGQRRTILIHARPIWDDIKKIVGSVAVLMDMTEQVKTEAALKDADRRKDEFLAMLAHELRNPLAPISAAAELLTLINLDDARVRHTSEVIRRQVDHMTNLVDDLLDVSRVTRGLILLQNAPLDICHIVTDAVEQVNPLIYERHHHLALHLPPEITMVMGDNKRLVQVISNLLTNAAKYTHEGGKIVLKTQVLQDQIVLTIEDDGIGMAPDLVVHAFDLFAQGECTSDRSSGGLGLGLSLAKNLVELHGGKVTCASEGIGKGSKFTIYLPRLVELDQKISPRRSDRRSLPSMKALKILIVDDNDDAANMLCMFLEVLGHQTSVEHSSLRALERARIELPDVCLLDIGLPEMDGNELARRLRGQPETAKTVLIAVTGYGQDNDRKNSLAAGFDHHMVKPVNTAQLATLLGDVGNA
jgi:signal transduction histidine kinase